MLRLDYLQRHGYDLSRRMGTVLRSRFNFQIISSIREAYIQAFGEEHTDVRDAILHPSLKALAEARNALVHRAGIADQHFMDEYQRCNILQTVFPGAEVGKPLPMSGIPIHNLIHPVVKRSVELIAAVSRVVTSGPENGAG